VIRIPIVASAHLLADREVPDWPKLLHLYSRLKPGITVYQWMQEFDVEDLGIDVRRFTSFGVVKVCLHYVHCHVPCSDERSLLRDSYEEYTAGPSSWHQPVLQ
jgi:hypothetical protein